MRHSSIAFTGLALILALLSGCGGAGVIPATPEETVDSSVSEGSPESITKSGADDNTSGATTLPFYSCIQPGYLSKTGGDSYDWWKITDLTTLCAADKQLKITLKGNSNSCTADGSNVDFDLELYQGTSTFVKGAATSSANEILYYTPISCQNHYLKVIAFSGSGNYTLKAEMISLPVDKASFVSENYPDGYDLPPNTPFTKTWTIKNTGTTTWNSNYYLQYVSGPMSTNTSNVYISGTVSPNGTYTFSVPMKTPSSAGTYKDSWSLKNGSGTTINVSSSATVWALIDVVAPSQPNLKPYTPSGWTGPLIVNSTGTKSGGGTLYANDCGTTYISWAVDNDGNAAASETFYSRLYLDGNLIYTWNTSGLANGYYTYVDNWTTKISYGSHTLKLVTDDTGVIAESNENDNSTSVTYTWDGCPPLAAITVPNNGNDIFTGQSSEDVKGTCTSRDGTGISAVKIKNLATGWSTSSGGTTNFVFYNVPLSYGANKINVSCDSPSYWLSGDDWVTITRNTPPTATITSPNGGNNYTTTASSVDLSGTCSDVDSNLYRVKFRNLSTSSEKTTDISGGNWSGSKTLTLQNGTNDLKFECWDTTAINGDGVVASDSMTVTSNQTATISGTVTNGSGYGILGATVTAIGPQTTSTTTNSDGQYTLSGLTAGTYELQAKKDGYYNSAVQTKTVSAGSSDNAYFVLTKIPAAGFSATPDALSVAIDSGMTDGSQSITVSNTGDGTLTYTPSANVNWASIQKNGATVGGTTVSLAPGGKDKLVVMFNSNGITASQSGTVTITHNDSTQGTKTISLTMTINPAKPEPPPPAEQPAPETPAFKPADYGECTEKNACYADPVNTAIGNYIYEHTDLQINARGPSLIFARHHNSRDKTLGPLGLGWNHSLNSQIVIQDNGDAYIRWGDGRTDKYTWESATGGFNRPAGIFATLTKGTQYVLTDKDDNVWVFSLVGKMESITDRHNNKLTLSYDPNGQNRLEKATNAVGDTFTFTYISASDSKLASVTDETGTQRTVTFTYTGDLLTQVKDARGNSFGFAYDGANRMTTVTERDGKILVSNVYDSDGRVTTQKDGLNNVTTFAYDTPSAGETTVTDPAGQQHVYAYDSLYRLISHTGPSGDKASYLYNVENQVVQKTDANGKITQYTYDANGNVTSMTEPNGAITSWTYDANDNITSLTSPLGLVTTYDYDDAGNVSKSSYTLNGVLHETTYTYLATGEMKTTTDPLGYATTFSYSGKGELSSATNPAGASTSYDYDALHRKVGMTDPLLRKWTYQYDSNDNLKSVLKPNNQTENRSLDSRDRVASVNDSSGTITYSYDDAGRLVQITDPKGSIINDYNNLNQRTGTTDNAGAKTTYTFTSLGYVDTTTDPTGRQTRYSYDPLGRITSIEDNVGNKTTYTHNEIGLPKTSLDPLGHVQSYVYNHVGAVTNATDSANNSYLTNYDAAGRITKIANPLQSNITQTYDKNGRLTSLTTPAGTTFTWKHDSVGRITEVASPTGTKRSLAYDAAGQLTGITNANNQTTTQEFDALGRVTKASFADGQVRTTTYDTAGNITQVAQDGKARSFSYDSASRMIGCTDPWGKTISYSYDTAGNLASITYPGNKTVSYVHDSAGRLTQVTDFSGGITSYSYDTAGRLQQTIYPNSTKTIFSYDDASKPITISHQKSDGAILVSQTITYDSRSNVTAIQNTPEPTSWIDPATTDYTSNSEDQYTQVGSELLGYDPVGQMLTRDVDGSTTSYTFDARERLSGIDGAVAATYLYGPQGERIQKTEKGITTRYVVDMNATLPRVLAEMDENNTITAYYIYGVGLLAKIPASGSDVRYYHRDVQFNTAALSDSAGAITDTYVYHPFGKVIAKTGTTDNPFQFAGIMGVQHDESGLLYMRARYYDPYLGRFISKDLLDATGGDFNLYSYVRNNPLGLTDPSGMFFLPDVVLDIGFIIYDVASLITDPSWGNVIALGLDVGAAFIPIATGAGSAYKITKATAKAEKAKDTGNLAEKTYQTYIKKNPNTGQTYVGHTSGTGTPLENVKARDMGHHKTKDGFGQAELQATFDTKGAARGHEQMLYDKYKKAGKGADQNLPIADSNPKKQSYMDAAKSELYPKKKIPTGLGALYNACEQTGSCTGVPPVYAPTLTQDDYFVPKSDTQSGGK